MVSSVCSLCVTPHRFSPFRLGMLLIHLFGTLPTALPDIISLSHYPNLGKGVYKPLISVTTLSTEHFFLPLHSPAIVHSGIMTFIPVAPPKVSLPSVDSTSLPQAFVMPDLVSHCAFNLRVHEELPRAVWECKAWMINGSNISRNEKTLNSLHGLKAGGLFYNLRSSCVPLPHLVVSLELTCACYPLAPLHKLRVCCDFMNWLFHLDDISDDMDDRNTVTIGNEVMATYYHPDAYDPKTHVGKLTKRYAPLPYQSEHLTTRSSLQLLDSLHS